MNSRYYNPEWGRFINADGIVGQTGELLSHNMFMYCKNNPVNMLDDSGYWPKWVSNALKVTAAIVATAVTVVAVVAAAPAVAGVVGVTALYYGASTAVAGALSLAATIGCATVAAGVVVTGGNRAIEAATGTNYAARAIGEGNYEKMEGAVNTAAMLITAVPQYTGYPSTGRTKANNLKEQMALDAAIKNPLKGEIIIPYLKDKRFPGWMGWQKYAMTSYAQSGNIQIHYVGNKIIPFFFDFKISE